MTKKAKLFFSLISLCFSLAVLCFGVYSSVSVSYEIGGNINYVVEDVFVKVDVNIYRALSNIPISADENISNVTTLQGVGANIPNTLDKVEKYTTSFYTYDPNTGEIVKPGEDYTFPEIGEYIPINLTYGLSDDEDLGFAYYVVVDITNYGGEFVNAVIQNNTTGATLNTNFYDVNVVNINPSTDSSTSTGRLIIGMALADEKIEANGNFSYTIIITKGTEVFENNNIKFPNSTDVVVKNISINGSTVTYNTPVTFAEMGTLSLNTQNIEPNEEQIVKITLQSNATTQRTASGYQKFILSYSNLPTGLRVNSTSLFLPQDGSEKVYTIKFYNASLGIIPLNSVQILISLDSVSNLLMQDPSGYYYVEMGTVMRPDKNEYIRWRYIANENRTSASTPTNISSLNGTYILETDLVSDYLTPAYTLLSNNDLQNLDEFLANNYTGTLCSYQSIFNLTRTNSAVVATNIEYNTNANEYATSTVRRYLNYTGNNKVFKFASFTDMGEIVLGREDCNVTSKGNQNASKTNMVTDLNIDVTQDVVYNAIKARSLNNDLYADIIPDVSSKVPSLSEQTGLTNENADKFWLLSSTEASKIFTENEERNWNKQEQSYDIYWLRTPSMPSTDGACDIFGSGGIGGDTIYQFFAVRPAFQIC